MERKNEIVKKLNALLADCSIFYTNLRGFHWNIKGDKFFELHQLYEEYYNLINTLNDDIAERILQLDATPVNSYSKYIKTSKIKEVEGISDWNTGFKNLYDTMNYLIKEFTDLADLTLVAKDHATYHFVIGILKNFEKRMWMLKAYQKN